MIPATTFGGMTDPVSSMEGAAKVMGEIYPASHMFTISRGVFAKALGFSELSGSFLPLAISAPVIVGIAILLLKKQET
jgi:ribosome-dependent ATPase